MIVKIMFILCLLLIGISISAPYPNIPDLSSASIWLDKGNALYGQGKYDEAILAYNKAIEFCPQQPFSWINKGDALCGLGKYEEAIQAYNKAIELDPQFADAWNSKGHALAAQGKYDDAIQAYDTAIEIKPQFSEAWNNKGVALKALSHTTDADAAFAKAKELEALTGLSATEPSGPRIVQMIIPAGLDKNLAKTKVIIEKLEASRKSLKNNSHSISKSANITRDHVTTSGSNGISSSGQNNVDDWVNQSTLLNQSKFDEAIHWLNQGIDLLNQSKFDESIQAFNRVLHLDPSDSTTAPLAWKGKGIALYGKAEYNESKQAYENSRYLLRNDSGNWEGIGDCLKALGRTSEANAAYAGAKELGYTG